MGQWHNSFGNKQYNTKYNLYCTLNVFFNIASESEWCCMGPLWIYIIFTHNLAALINVAVKTGVTSRLCSEWPTILYTWHIRTWLRNVRCQAPRKAIKPRLNMTTPNHSQAIEKNISRQSVQNTRTTVVMVNNALWPWHWSLGNLCTSNISHQWVVKKTAMIYAAFVNATALFIYIII
jgi:hypothetical protein